MSYIHFHRINKLYDSGVHAIKDVSFDIEEDQFTVLVGPSGCGKSTLLRMLAGLEEITTGRIEINGQIINEIPPKDRNISMVFQNYALYPHLTVYDNIAFGLRLKRVKTPIENEDGSIKGYKTTSIPRDVIDKKVREVAEQLELTDYLSRKPKQLSGGQKQRVALARALVRNNDIFLLDEPLSNLDAKLRVDMRKTIKALHNSVKKPFIYVTHDQVEAMTLADRIVVLKKGVVQQIGSPKEIFDEPNNLFVATFFGSPAMSIIEGTLIMDNNRLAVKLLNDDILYVPQDLIGQFLDYSLLNKKVLVGLRPSSFRVTPGDKKDHYSKIHGDVIHKELFGNETLIKFKVADNNDLLAFVPNNFKSEDKIELYAHTSSMKIFSPETEESIFGLAKESNFKQLDYERKEDSLVISFKDNELVYPLESRLLKFIPNEGKLNLSIINEFISTEEVANSFMVEGEVILVKNLFQRKAVYLKIKGQDSPLMVFVNKDKEVKVKDKLKVYLPLDYITLTDENNEPLLAKYEIHNYVTGDDLQIVKKTLKLDDITAFEMQINNVKIYHRKEKIDKKDYHIFKVVVLDVENNQGKSILYYRIKGMKGYFTALIDEEIDMVKTPTLKLVIKK